MCTVRTDLPLVTVMVTGRVGPAAVLATPNTTGCPSLARATGSMRTLSAGCNATAAPVLQLSETRMRRNISASIEAPVGIGLADAESRGTHTSRIGIPGPPRSTVVPHTATGPDSLYTAQPLAAAHIETTQRVPATMRVRIATPARLGGVRGAPPGRRRRPNVPYLDHDYIMSRLGTCMRPLAILPKPHRSPQARELLDMLCSESQLAQSKARQQEFRVGAGAILLMLCSESYPTQSKACRWAFGGGDSLLGMLCSSGRRRLVPRRCRRSDGGGGRLLALGPRGRQLPGKRPLVVYQARKTPTLQSRSTIIAMPWPPPTHIVSSPIDLSWKSREFSRVPVMRAPVMPNGCPTAIAPPLTLSLSRSMPRSR